MRNRDPRIYRYLAEKCILGRPLRPGEVVHHKNRKVWDDSVENLQVMTRSEHSKEHGAEWAARGRMAQKLKNARWEFEVARGLIDDKDDILWSRLAELDLSELI